MPRPHPHPHLLVLMDAGAELNPRNSSSDHIKDRRNLNWLNLMYAKSVQHSIPERNSEKLSN